MFFVDVGISVVINCLIYLCVGSWIGINGLVGRFYGLNGIWGVVGLVFI